MPKVRALSFLQCLPYVSFLPLVVFASGACSSKSDSAQPTDGGADTGNGASTVTFNLEADFSTEEHFYDFPYPSDLRLGADGKVQGNAFPNPLKKSVVDGLRIIASDHVGFPVAPVAYFHFDHALAKHLIDDVVAAHASSPVLLVDVDDASPEKGRFFPLVTQTIPTDDYVPEYVLGVAPRPGMFLHEKRKYAFVVKRTFGDDKGAPLSVPAGLASLASGQAPAGAHGAAALALYAPMFAVLKDKGIAATDVAAATVFTTGDAPAELAALTDKMLPLYDAPITDLVVDPDDGAKHDRYCEIKGSITYPQFQKGAPLFDKEGLFVVGADGLPVKQRDEKVPIVLTLPKGAPMPAGGYPLHMYFHGSGGLSAALVDRGTWRVESDPTKCPEGKLEKWLGTLGCNTKGEGPAFVVAPFGLAAASSALPINPERVPGASEHDYINFANLAAMRDTFRQGVIEQRLFMKALRTLTIPPSVVATCTGLSLPTGETAYHFNDGPVTAQGQSMGGMYTNMVGAIEPRIQAVVPTGAGGYWSYFITLPNVLGYPHVGGFIAAYAGTDDNLIFFHPMLHLFQTGVEPIEPSIYTTRLARRPFAGRPVRPIYEPVGKGDTNFPEQVYDVMALGYGHKEAGTNFWPSMQDALKLAGLDGLLSYPVSQDLKSESGTPFTGVIVQYEGDGIYDAHALYTQLDAVKYQYGCFLATFHKKGIATVPAPAPLGTPCPGM